MNTTADASPTRRAKPPITAHPWFPAVTGLWFAALFGLTSLALPPALLERVVTTLGIDRIVAAAEPPLGQTARLLVALGLSSLGEIAGLLLGRWLGARHTAAEAGRQRAIGPKSEPVGERRARDAHPDAPPRKPFSPGEAGAGVELALRRRALASEAEHAPAPFIDMAPLPGGAVASPEPAAFDPDDRPALISPGLEPEPADMIASATAAPADALDLGDFAQAQPGPVAVSDETDGDVPDRPSPAAATQPSAAVSTADVATASLDTLGVVQLSERLALAMQARRVRLAERATIAIAPPVLAAVPVVEPQAGSGSAQPIPTVFEAVEPGDVAAPAAEPAAELLSATEVAMALPRLPGLLTGIQPFADDHDEHDEAMPALARSLRGPTGPFSRPDEATTAFPGPEADQPAPDEPVDGSVAGEAVAESDASPELARGLAILARRAARGDDDASGHALPTEDDDGLAAQDSYSSLLSIGGASHRDEPVRIEIEDNDPEIEPVVVFPGHGAHGRPAAPGPFASPFAAPAHPAAPAPTPSATGEAAPLHAPAADPAEAERALKAALASLQRVSGLR